MRDESEVDRGGMVSIGLEGLKEGFMPSLLDVARLRSGVLFLRYGFGAAGDAA